jgi:hypothetical protein
MLNRFAFRQRKPASPGQGMLQSQRLLFIQAQPDLLNPSVAGKGGADSGQMSEMIC